MTPPLSKLKFLVTGGGQLAQCIEFIVPQNQKDQFYFLNKSEFDITNQNQINDFVEYNPIDIIINCAAYTHVGKAESNPKCAQQVNVNGVDRLIKLCQKHNTFLFHISTDYVFDGQKREPYTESDSPNPINQYGKSKTLGEQLLLESKIKAIIIRSSWIFSPFGTNFFKSILSQIQQNKTLEVVNNQYGCPTYGIDLAQFILSIANQFKTLNHRIYHFVNSGVATWYDVAKHIIDSMPMNTPASLVGVKQKNSIVKRPEYSALNTTRIRQEFNMIPRNWKVALTECISKIQ
ncbi:MAG: dTDP-4-dehydrorhamnose reductase [Flavobacteriaceae bacterium]|nr:dTDP-4-dehydrorhamnose reductase [Flavobacteriaceae bacterium]